MSSENRTGSPNMRTATLLIAMLGSLLPVLAQAQLDAIAATDADAIPTSVRQVIAGHKLPADSYSFMVQEVGAQEALLKVNAEQSMNPASAMKVITTLAALETLGPAYTWKTELYATGPVVDGTLQGDLILKGKGDPFLVEEQLRSMLKTLLRSGIAHISGDLILDGSYFDAAVTNTESIDNQGGRSYNTDPNAILANFQVVTFYFYPHTNGRDVVIRADPQLPDLVIENHLRLRDAPCSGYQRGISFDVNKDKPNEIVFSGQFPARCQQYQLAREVLDAPLYTFGLFKNLWEQLGGKLDGTLRIGTVPIGQNPVLVWDSPPLSDVITSINKYSNNLMTRHLLLTLGAEQLGAPATVEKGVAAVNAYLELKSLDSTLLHMENGAGLSRRARVTATLMNDVLQSAWQSPFMPEFLSSLPVNGMDGTMRNRLRSNSRAGRMHVKTGTLDEVSAIAGYVYARSGKMYTVTGILNHELADRGPGVELMDALLAWVYLQ